MDAEFRYRAFISYSHRDEQWARWLHKSLETYRIPKHLVGTTTASGEVPARFAPIFRDRDELPTATNLGAVLTEALRQSAFQIEICSPAAAKSHWVNEEILAFKRLGREHRIFALLVGGEPGSALRPGHEDEECFPRALQYVMGADGQLTADLSEPIAADVRPNKDGKRDALLKLLAGMLSVGFDTLKRRDAQRRRRRLSLLLAAATTGMVITSTLAATAWIARNEAERQRNRALAEAETARQTTRFLVDLFKVSDPSEALGNSITAREILDKGAQRIETELDAQPAIQATLMDTMGSVYTSLGLYDAAVPLMQQALEKRRTLFGAEHAEVAQSLTNLGEALTQKSDYAAAERDLTQALEIRRRQLERDSPEIATTLSALADVLTAQGEYARAQPLIREALEIRIARFGPGDRSVAESRTDLGQNAADRGDYTEAERELRLAADLQRAIRPGPHPQLAEAINNLALLLVGIDRAPEAEPLFAESVAMMRRIYPDGHPSVAATLNNLAYSRETRGDAAGAEAAYREALALYRRLLGDDHPEVASTLSNIAFVMYAGGQHRQATEVLRDALRIRRAKLGTDHPDVAGSAASLAYWLVDAGAYDEAARLIDESLGIRRRQLGNDHPSVATTLAVQASLQVARRQYEAALESTGEAERILAPNPEVARWQLAMVRNVRGAALAGQRRFSEAEPLLLESLGDLDGAPVPGLRRKGQQRLESLYRSWNKPDMARRYSRP